MFTLVPSENRTRKLGLTGEKEPIEVKVANDQTIRFMSGTYTLFINGGTRGRVWVEYMEARRKGLAIQMKTKQSMECEKNLL